MPKRSSRGDSDELDGETGMEKKGMEKKGGTGK